MRMTTVYNADGEAFEVNNLNALDLTRQGNFSFKNPKAETAIPVSTKDLPKTNGDTDAVPDADASVVFDTLEDEAKAVADTDDLVSYLSTKDPAWLRTYAEKHYEQKVHGRTSKDKIIEMILGWEEQKHAAEEDAE